MEAVEVASHDLGSLAGTLLNSPIDQHKLGTPSPQVASMSATPVNGSLNSISAQAQVEIQLPVVLLFGTEQVPQGHVIPQAELQKIPRHVIHHILKSGQSVGEGYHKVHMLGATHLCDSLLRVKDFLNHGDYTPFTPKLDLQVVDKAGRVTTVTGPVENAEGLRTTEETYELFRKEVALYIFAGCYRYKELLLFSSHKIRTAYPVLARETFLLLEKGHRIAVQTKDQPLIDFILDATRKNSKGLTEEQGFVPLLRRSVKDDPISQILLEAHIQQAQSAKAAMDADSLLANIPVNSIPTPSSPAVKSEQSLESRITRPLVPTPSQQLFQLKEALIQERLVIAKDDGYGTLISPTHRDGEPIIRNREFKFIKNELLLVSYGGKSFNGRHNIMVENSKGMKGDILHTLVKVVPMDLGITDYPVNCGKEDLDREQRAQVEMDRVYTYRRSRSRSPVRWN